MKINRNLAVSLGVLALLVGLGLAGRLVPHPPNFAPVAACALFAGFFFRDLRLALATPLLILLVSDQSLGGYPWPVMLTVYAALAFPVALRGLIRRKLSALRVGGSAVACSLVFFLTTNFAHWAFIGMYDYNMAGLAASYAAGLPFLKYTLAGDLFYSGVLFGAYVLAARLAGLPTKGVGVPVRVTP